MTLLSAVIPTRDRPEMLGDALATLQRQTLTDLEVVVVDDGSECDLAAVVARAAGPVPVRHVRQEPAGLNVGRNRGVSEASGDLVAFLDDDVLVDAGWAESVVEAFEAMGADAVAGRIVLQLEGPEPAWLTPGLRRYLAELDLGEAAVVDVADGPYGANCAVRREWYERVGGFRAGLDRIGTSLVSNGDVEFFRDVRSAGGRVVYHPAARVLHRVPPGRLTVDFFRRRARAQGVSDVLLESADATGPGWRHHTRELACRARSGPILARGVLSGRGVLHARLWREYCHGRRQAWRDLRRAGRGAAPREAQFGEAR